MTAAIRLYWHRVRAFRTNARLYLACTILRSVTMGLSSLLFNLYLTSMGFDSAFIGLNSTLLSAATILCSLPAGLVADRIGRKRAMIAGLVGMTVAQSGLALFQPGWLILFSNMLFGGVGSLFMASVAPFLMENSTKEERSILFTLDSSLMNLTSFFAMTGGGYLPGLFAALLQVGPESAPAYRAVILASAGTMALALLPVLALRDPDRPRSAQRLVRTTSRIWRRFSNPSLLVKLLIPRTLTAFGAGLVFPFINLFYKQRFHVSDATLGWILGITSVTAALVMLVGGGVADRLGKIRAMFVARAISVPLLVVIGFAPWLPVVVAAHWSRSGFMRLGDPLYLAFAMEQLAENERAAGASLMMISWEVGWSLGPYVSGLVQLRSGFGPLFVGTTVFYILSLISVYAFFMRKGPDRAPQPLARETD